MDYWVIRWVQRWSLRRLRRQAGREWQRVVEVAGNEHRSGHLRLMYATPHLPMLLISSRQSHGGPLKTEDKQASI